MFPCIALTTFSCNFLYEFTLALDILLTFSNHQNNEINLFLKSFFNLLLINCILSSTHFMITANGHYDITIFPRFLMYLHNAVEYFSHRIYHNSGSWTTEAASKRRSYKIARLANCLGNICDGLLVTSFKTSYFQNKFWAVVSKA